MIAEIFSVVWTIIITGSIVYNRFYGSTKLGDETLFTLDNRYERQINVAILTERQRGETLLAEKLQERDNENNRRLKEQADEHNQALEAQNAKISASQERIYQLTLKVNDYLEKISGLQDTIISLQSQNKDQAEQIGRLERAADKQRDKIEAAREAANASEIALQRERDARKLAEQALNTRIDELQHELQDTRTELQKARKEATEAELEKARLRGMIEGVSYQQEKQKTERKKSTEENKQP